MDNRIPQFIQQAVRLGASDLHVLSDACPTVRIDGEVGPLEGPVISAAECRDMLVELLTDYQRKRLEERLAAEFAYQEDVTGRRCRVSVYYEKGHLQGAFRILPELVRNRDDLGLPAILEELATRRHGLVLVTGPVGVGKTTTLNWIVDHINRTRRCRIITIEDPVEFVHRNVLANVAQREVGRDCNSFPEALVQALRQDPDVICVGEMRDLESISTALTAAETGHLVLSTLHTPNAALTIDRIVDVFPSATQNQIRIQLANALTGIMSQQLLRRAGGSGRALAYELLLPTNAIRNMIRENHTAQLTSAMSTSREHGMMTMDQCIRGLVIDGIVTREEAMTHVNVPEAFRDLPDIASHPVMAGVRPR